VAHTAVHNEFRAGDEGAIARRQKDRRLADVISSSQTSQGRFTGEEALLFGSRSSDAWEAVRDLYPSDGGALAYRGL